MATPRTAVLSWFAAAILALQSAAAQSGDPPAPAVSGVEVNGNQATVRFQPHPAAQQYKVLTAPELSMPFLPDAAGSQSGFSWTTPRSGAQAFYRLSVTPLSPQALAVANLLNRIAYGPTPDELARVTALGPDAYIAEQLTPESIQEQLEIDKPTVIENGWRRIETSGVGTSSTLYVYLTSIGEGYIDDLSLVEGTVAGVGNNLIRNGGFESPLATNDWVVATNHTDSTIVTDVKHSGSASLKLVATAPGSTRSSAIVQELTPALSASRTYTLSYWFRPITTTNAQATATVRLSGYDEDTGRGVLATSAGSIYSQLLDGEATIAALRSWHVLRAVQSRRQLLEVLLQFLENHFVTEYTKSADFFDRYYDNDDARRRASAVDVEFKEIQRWRAALLNPQCTFHDLLKISAESPAQIIYLDTVDSRGDGTYIANENYARELLELYTFGVDNGYDQNDIVEVSKTWTGWSVRRMARANEFNPTERDLHGNLSGNAIGDLEGVWAFKYRPERHHNKAKLIFAGKTVPDRFGAPWAGRSYELSIPAVAANSTNTIQEGYTVLRHLADQPFTQEFISVKLCRLFVHDDFHVGYDFTDPNLSAEGKLVLECMKAWEAGNPKGQIRSVLLAILASDLFRSHGGSMQKVKTPLEFVVSAVRALRADVGNGAFTATTSGNVHNILNRMGSMRLFDRAEPDGYPEGAAPWISSGTLAERLRFVQSMLLPTGSRTEDALSCTADPVTLLKARLPQASWSDAGAVSDLFLGLLFPAEGTANLDLYKRAAIRFLDTGDDGVAASPFRSLNQTAAAYDTRVRGMVAMLLTFPRFQEQ